MSAPSNHNYGFVKRLLTWAASAAMVVTAVSAAALFYATYEKAYDEQDDLLEEVSGVLARIDVSNKHPGALWMDDDDFEDWFIVDDDSPQSIAKAGSTILVRTLHKGGQTIRVVFDKDLHDGAQTLSIGDTDYRLYLITLSDGKHIAVAQKTKEIEKLARQAALAATLPLLGLSVTFFIILAVLLWFAVKPIKSLTDEINRRKPDDLTPIDPRELPSELLPMVDAFNGVLKRIDELRQSESRFVADAAHELRSPLAALSLQAERLEKAAVSDEAKKQISDLRVSIDRATRLVSQLLSLKRAQQNLTNNSQKPAVISQTLSMVIEQIWSDAERKSIEIEALGFDEFDPESPFCNNCGSCAFAVYQRLEGISDCCATANNINYNSEMEALTGMEQVSMSPDEIEMRLLAEGDGAHAIIGIDRAQGPGHWFNAACIDGRVVAIDGQSGDICEWPPDYGDVVNWEMSIKRE